MPTYDYYCPSNGRTVEVRHSLSETVSNWGELCRCAGIEPGETPADAPVTQCVAAPAVATASPPAPRCAKPGCGCG